MINEREDRPDLKKTMAAAAIGWPERDSLSGGRTGSERDNELLISQIRQLHRGYPLCCSSKGGLMSLDDRMLLYLVSLMNGSDQAPPACGESQWLSLLAALRCHWVYPFLFRQLASRSPGLQPPAPFIDALRRSYVRSTMDSLIASRQLAGLAEAFGRDGIEFLVLKGAALSRIAYDDAVLRPGGDIDLLVRPAHLPAAHETMEKAGYSCSTPLSDVSAHTGAEVMYFHRDGQRNPFPVELHWNPTYVSAYNQNVDLEGYFQRSVPFAAGGKELRSMDAVDSLIHAAAHMFCHHCDNIRLSWINDIALLYRRVDTAGAVEELIRRNRGSLASCFIDAGLTMAALWTGTDVHGYYDRQPPGHDVPGTGGMYDIMHKERSLLSHFRMYWPARAGIPEKCRYVKELFFPNIVVMRSYFPGETTPLYKAYVKRWIILAGKYKIR
jgi:hypothetical protein